MTTSKIEWTDRSDWNPIRGCLRVSEGCRHCYAESIAARFSGAGQPFEGFATRAPAHWTGKVELVPEHLGRPLKWRKWAAKFARPCLGRACIVAPCRQCATGEPPRRPRVFACSMADLFHERLSNEDIAAVFGVMAACPEIDFQVLTKRPERMREWMSDPQSVFLVQRAMDAIAVDEEMRGAKEERRAIPGFPDYQVSNLGKVYSLRGSSVCPWCGGVVSGSAKRLYCSTKCSLAALYAGRSNHERAAVEMSPDTSSDGHLRVMLYRGDSEPIRALVHRLVLTAFDRPPLAGEEGCHRNATPSDNRLSNLRWGTREENRADRERHGRAKSWSKLTPEQVESIRERLERGHPAERIGRDFGVSGTQVRNIGRGDQWATKGTLQWPLPWVWLGVSVEDQATADERIPLLLQTPAAVRFVSYEPALGPVDFLRIKRNDRPGFCDALIDHTVDGRSSRSLDWIIVGGESGPGARPCDLAWIRSTVEQCRAAGVACFVKQLGAKPIHTTEFWGAPCRPDGITDRKGGNPSEWPSDLRVREFPR